MSSLDTASLNQQIKIDKIYKSFFSKTSLEFSQTLFLGQTNKNYVNINDLFCEDFKKIITYQNSNMITYSESRKVE